jgi:hypothetical protein
MAAFKDFCKSSHNGAISSDIGTPMPTISDVSPELSF